LATSFTWETFKTSFLEAWGETEEEQTAKDKLKCMQQKGTCSMYVTEFNHYALLSHFNELVLQKTLLRLAQEWGERPPPHTP
jgi:S-adenosylhomocysteine hydrolase